jgi:hypothetical protein
MSHPNQRPQRGGPDRRWSARESRRMFDIMSEFVAATERLSDIRLLNPALYFLPESR